MSVWIWDAAVVLLIAGSAYSAYRRGFFRSLVSFAGTVASFLVGRLYSGPVARYCYETYLEKGISEGVREGVLTNGTQSFETILSRIDEVLAKMPKTLTDVVRSQLDADSLEVWYQNMIRANSGDIATALMEGVVTPIVTTVLQILAFCMIFLVCAIVVRFAARLLGGLRRTPILGSADGLVGAVFGALRGLLYAFVLAAVMWLLIRLTGDRLPFVTQSELQHAAIFGRFFKAVSNFGTSV